MALVVFEDLPSTNTPLNAQNLNNNFNELASGITGTQTTSETITLLTTGWVENSSTGYYEYTVTDTDVTANYLINGYMDLENQNKMEDGYIQSANGSYKIITSTLPEEAITMQITKQLLQVEGASL